MAYKVSAAKSFFNITRNVWNDYHTEQPRGGNPTAANKG